MTGATTGPTPGADRFDLVVVGGGSAGCVVAARASADPARRVLLVEAGPDPRPVPNVIADPARQDEVIRDPEFVRHYPVRRADGSAWRLVSGKILGGGSAVNNLSVTRPIRRDFDAWQGFGGEAWSYEALLPLMRAVEDDPDFGDAPLHGRGGPIRLVRSWWPDESVGAARAIVEAALDLGLPICRDLNVPEPLGICASPYNLVEGRRLTVAAAFLDPVRDRPNLTILAGTAATRLVLDGRQSTAVELTSADGVRVVGADRIVVSAGAYQTPQLLQVSGIGPPDVLEAAGVDVVHPLAGVGANFQDHAVVDVAYEAGPDLAPDERLPKIRIIAKSRPDLDYGDLHLLFRASPPAGGGPRRLVVSVRLLDHRSRGRIRIASADPAALPGVEPAILADPADLRAIVDGVDLVERLVRRPALRRIYGRRVIPEGAGDEAVAAHARATHITYNHAVGTCRFGPAGDPLAVVDPSLRVHGLENLWVADASVLPVIPHAATNVAAVLVGEVAARDIARGAVAARDVAARGVAAG